MTDAEFATRLRRYVEVEEEILDRMIEDVRWSPALAALDEYLSLPNISSKEQTEVLDLFERGLRHAEQAITLLGKAHNKIGNVHLRDVPPGEMLARELAFEEAFEEIRPELEARVDARRAKEKAQAPLEREWQKQADALRERMGLPPRVYWWIDEP
jgi:hypothetical protein